MERDGDVDIRSRKSPRKERKELESETLSGVNKWAKEKRKEKKGVGPYF